MIYAPLVVGMRVVRSRRGQSHLA